MLEELLDRRQPRRARPLIDSARYVHALWAIVVGLGALVWFKFVRSEANVADMPSRGKLDFVHTLHRPVSGSTRAERVEFILPSTDSWPSVEEALAAGKLAGAAVFEAAARKRSRGRRRS